jgi:hypothetical protein
LPSAPLPGGDLQVVALPRVGRLHDGHPLITENEEQQAAFIDCIRVWKLRSTGLVEVEWALVSLGDI